MTPYARRTARDRRRRRRRQRHLAGHTSTLGRWHSDASHTSFPKGAFAQTSTRRPTPFVLRTEWSALKPSVGRLHRANNVFQLTAASTLRRRGPGAPAPNRGAGEDPVLED